MPRKFYLIIEIAESSAKFDCETKEKIYAQAKIATYQVLDIVERKLWVLRNSSNDSYLSEIILGEGTAIAPLQFPDLQIEHHKYQYDIKLK